MLDITTGACYVANELYSGYQDYACALLVTRSLELIPTSRFTRM